MVKRIELSPEEVLGLQKGASMGLINRRRKELAQQLHPDVNPNGGDQLAKINEAYAEIKARTDDEFEVVEQVFNMSDVKTKKIGKNTIQYTIDSSKIRTVIPEARRLTVPKD